MDLQDIKKKPPLLSGIVQPALIFRLLNFSLLGFDGSLNVPFTRVRKPALLNMPFMPRTGEARDSKGNNQ